MTREDVSNCLEQIKNIIMNSNSWTGEAKTIVEECFNTAIKSLELLQTISNLFSKWKNGEVDDNEYYFQMQNILLFGKTLEGEVSE